MTWFQTFTHLPGICVAAESCGLESAPMDNKQRPMGVQETVIQLRRSDACGLVRRIRKPLFQRSRKDLVKCWRSFKIGSAKDIKPVDKRPCAAMEHTRTWLVVL